MNAGVNIEIGLERFVDEQRERGTRLGRLGLLTNRASVGSDLSSSVDWIEKSQADPIQAIFTPQHGWWGEQQANMIETPDAHVQMWQAPVYSLYAEDRRPSAQQLHGLDHLVIDLQDVGVRVYTFVWTMLYCLQACAAAGVKVLVLDRPNPIGGESVEGPLLNLDCRSFVGEAAIPMRHGLTIGELAKLFVFEQEIDVDLKVIAMQGWSRRLLFSDLQRHWIPPSPNLPTARSALVYPGQVLLEGANVSEGRGTTIPFECLGAPFIDPQRMKDACDAFALPGVRFLATRFTPSFDKWAGRSCGGVSLQVTDARTFRPYRTSICLLRACQSLWPQEFAWRPPPYEYEATIPPIDIISGDQDLRLNLMADAWSNELLERLSNCDLEAWRGRTEDHLLYARC